MKQDRAVMMAMDRVRESRAGAPDVRGLKALVIGLGVLIVLGTALVIGVVVKRLMESTHKPVPNAGMTAMQPAAMPPSHPFAMTLPGTKGAAIGGIAASGGTIAIWLRDDKGGRIDFIDPRTGALSGTAVAP